VGSPIERVFRILGELILGTLLSGFLIALHSQPSTRFIPSAWRIPFALFR